MLNQDQVQNVNNKQQVFNDIAVKDQQRILQKQEKQQKFYKENKKKNKNDLAVELKRLVETLKGEMVQKGLSTDVHDMLSHPQQYMTYVNEFRSDINKSMPYSKDPTYKENLVKAENDIFRQKTGFYPNSVNLNALMNQYGIRPGTLNHKQLRDLVVLDDWTTVIGPAVMSGLERYGPQVIDYLWQKFMGFAKGIFPGKDWGGSAVDQGDKPLDQSYKLAMIPGQTFMDRPPLTGNLHTDTPVRMELIRSILCPEAFSSILYNSPIAYCSTLTSSVDYTINTGTDGNQLIVIVPDLLAFTTITYPYDSFVSTNFQTFNPLTGATTNPSSITNTYFAGPLATLGGLAQYRCVSLSYSFIPTQNDNVAQGEVSCTQIQNQLNLTTTASLNIACTPQSFSSSPYYVTGNFKSVYRQAAVPSTYQYKGTWISSLTNTLSSRILLLKIEGALPNVVVGKLIIYYNAEVVVSANQRQYLQCEIGTQHTPTWDCISDLSYNTALYMQTSKDIKKLLLDTKRPDFKIGYSHVTNYFSSCSYAANDPERLLGSGFGGQSIQNQEYEQVNQPAETIM